MSSFGSPESAVFTWRPDLVTHLKFLISWFSYLLTRLLRQDMHKTDCSPIWALIEYALGVKQMILFWLEKMLSFWFNLKGSFLRILLKKLFLKAILYLSASKSFYKRSVIRFLLLLKNKTKSTLFLNKDVFILEENLHKRTFCSVEKLLPSLFPNQVVHVLLTGFPL